MLSKELARALWQKMMQSILQQMLLHHLVSAATRTAGSLPAEREVLGDASCTWHGLLSAPPEMFEVLHLIFTLVTGLLIFGNSPRNSNILASLQQKGNMSSILHYLNTLRNSTNASGSLKMLV